MKDRHEIKEVKFSIVFNNNINSNFRIDAEYYRKKYHEILTKLSVHECLNMESCTEWITQGPNPLFCNSGIPCLTGRNIARGRVSYENTDIVSDKVYNELIRFQLKKGDTLITLKGAGSVGKIGLVTSERKAIFSRNVGVLRPKDIDAAYLNAFLLSKYGQELILRGETGGTGQRTLTTSYLKMLMIPRFSNLENVVGDIVRDSESFLMQANSLYISVEQDLLDHLNLKGFELKNDCVSVKSFTESFGKTGRLDAEYYQPKYDEIANRTEHLEQKPLEEIVSIHKSIEPGSDAYQEEGIPFIRVSNLTKFELSEPDIFLSKKLAANIEELYLKKDTILLSKDGSVGIAYKVEFDMEAITSGAILHLKLKNREEINPDYLTLVLNSLAVRLQAERDAGGSIIQHWKPSEIEKVNIPILKRDIQLDLASKIQESYMIRRKSQEFLNKAKWAVDIAIEQGEEAALNYLGR